MIRIRTAAAWLLAGAVLAGSGCAKKTAAPPGAGGRPPLVKVVLQTDWYAEVEHGGFYTALVQGYYRDAGLDVEIVQGGPNGMTPQKIATGQADIAIGRSDDVIIFASRGVPVVMLGAFMQRDPQAIMFHRESGIRSFSDLDGRNLMAVPGSSFIPILERTFKIKLAITPSDFGMSRFLADRRFVQQCFVTNEPYYVRQQGADVGVLLLSDSGFAPYRVWYARRDFVAAHADVARAFAAATIRGWRDYIGSDHAAADARIAALNPKMDAAFLAFSRQAMIDYALVTGDPAAGDTVGRIDPARVEKEIRQLADIGLLDRPVAVGEVLDGAELPPESAPPPK